MVDGKTPAYEVEASTTIVIYDFYFYILATDIGDKTVVIDTYTADKAESKAILQEVARTLTIK